MIYGCGSAGTGIARRAAAHGMTTVLAGRIPSRSAAVAGQLGLPWRSSMLDNMDGLDRMLHGVDVLLNAAGPFAHTAAPLMRACIRNRCHYLDLSNEITTFNDAWSLDRGAREAGIRIVPGAGVGTAAVESLAAHVLTRIHAPLSMSVVRSSGGGADTAGIRKTTRALLAAGGARIREGRQLRSPNTVTVFDLPQGRRAAVPVATGDLFSTAHATGIRDISTYFSTELHPRLAGFAIPLVRQLLRTTSAFTLSPRTQRRTRANAESPARSSPPRDGQIWIRAENLLGETATSHLQLTAGAELTAQIAIRAVQQVESGNVTGALTSGELIGSGYVLELPGVRLTDR